MQENSDKQFSELKNKINEQQEHFTKETETLNKNQIELLNLKKSLKGMKNKLSSLGNKADQMELVIQKQKSVNDAEGRRERLDSEKKIKELYENYLMPSEKT